MPRIIVATQNKGKLREIASALSPRFEIIGLDALDTKIEIEEDADTFEGNAQKKVAAVAAVYNELCLSDDSGLEVDALCGAPGVHSARFGGPGLTDRERTLHLLREMSAIKGPNRTARFRSVIAFSAPGEKTMFFRGTLEGRIAVKTAGVEGFGYDPVFIPVGFDQTLATLGPSIKNEISHRAQALSDFFNFILKRQEGSL